MLAAATAALVAMPQDPVAGISRDLARERKAVVREVEYDLRFRLVPNGKSVEGSLWLRFRLPPDVDPSAPLVVDFAGEDLHDVRVNAKAASLRAVHDHVIVPPDLLVRDRNEIVASFRSPIAPSGTMRTLARKFGTA